MKKFGTRILSCRPKNLIFSTKGRQTNFSIGLRVRLEHDKRWGYAKGMHQFTLDIVTQNEGNTLLTRYVLSRLEHLRYHDNMHSLFLKLVASALLRASGAETMHRGVQSSKIRHIHLTSTLAKDTLVFIRIEVALSLSLYSTTPKSTSLVRGQGCLDRQDTPLTRLRCFLCQWSHLDADELRRDRFCTRQHSQPCHDLVYAAYSFDKLKGHVRHPPTRLLTRSGGALMVIDVGDHNHTLVLCD
ncbi:hypothetical protein Hypma_004096 [Hypsizygus marmoreus]|uniref:Uncharacterized protein n=1 Tax=Hypsizygus marmoreus TaxID=39966 RepID=A0A369K3X4_HYPMA|nr:hypothetical protein Hypma_004096 [Hypsizygus marmoreus]